MEFSLKIVVVKTRLIAMAIVPLDSQDSWSFIPSTIQVTYVLCFVAEDLEKRRQNTLDITAML